MDRYEKRAGPLVLAHNDFHDASAMRGGDPRPAAFGEVSAVGILRMNLHEWLRQMRGQPRAHAGPRHAVPLVADAAGVETERVGGGGGFSERGRLDGDKLCLAIGREEIAAGEETFFAIFLGLF